MPKPCEHTFEAERRQLERAAELMAQVELEDAPVVMELLSISYRAGVRTGESRAAGRLAWAL